MSRRQNRRSSKSTPTRSNKSNRSSKRSKSNKRRGLWWKVLLGVIGVFLVTGVVVYNRAIAFLHSDEFKNNLSKRVGDELGTKAAFGDFKWSGLSGENPSFKATGVGAIESVDVKDISFDVDFSYIKRDVFKIKKVKIGSVDATIDLQNKFLKFEGVEREKSFLEKLLPEKAELYDAQINNLSAAIHTAGDSYAADGVMASLKKHKKGRGYDVKAEGGRFSVPLDIVNNAYLKEANLKVRGEEVYINDSRFSVQESGILTLNGYVNLAKHTSKRYELDGSLRGLRCKHVFPPDWQKNLKGEVVSKFSMRPHTHQLPIFRGHLAIKNGTLEALPVLNDVAYYLADSRYRTVRFQKFECDFEKYEERINLTNIVLASKGLLKIEGYLTIDDRKLDGVFNVGLPPEKLSNIPGAETLVFLPGKENLNWAKVRISGTLDDINEDLTDRLIAAAGQRIVEEALRMGGEVINPDRIKKAMDITSGVLKGNKSVMEGISGILGGAKKLSPNPQEKSEPEKKEPEQEEKEKKEDKGLLPIPLPDPRKIPDILPF